MCVMAAWSPRQGYAVRHVSFVVEFHFCPTVAKMNKIIRLPIAPSVDPFLSAPTDGPPSISKGTYAFVQVWAIASAAR